MSQNKTLEQKIDQNAAHISDLRLATRIILHDRIKHLAKAHIKDGVISFADRSDLVAMHKVYHEDLGGNGNLDALMTDIFKLKLE